MSANQNPDRSRLVDLEAQRANIRDELRQLQEEEASLSRLIEEEAARAGGGEARPRERGE